MKRLLILIGVLATFITTGMAQVAYCQLNQTTLTFYYGQKPEQGAVWEVTEDWNTPCKETITTVVFDESFAYARPVSCYEWFKDFTLLTTVTGMEYLNTSEVTDMRYFFCNCTSLNSITIGSGFTVKSTTLTSGTYKNYFDTEVEYESMFKTHEDGKDPGTCLDRGTLVVKGTPTIEKDIFADVFLYGVLTSDSELEGINKNANGQISWKGGGFNIYNDYYNVNPEYGFVTDIGMAKAGTTVTITLDQNFQGITPKVSYYAGETYTKVPLTVIDGGWTFVMPAHWVTISEQRLSPVVALNADNKTFTLMGADSEDMNGNMQMLMMYLGGQQGDDNQFVNDCRAIVETMIIDETINQTEQPLTNVTRLCYGFSNLTTVTGLENLNMQNFRSTAYMFAGCSSLSSLTIGSNFYIGSEQSGFNATDMFDGCTGLATGTLTVNGTTAPTIEQDIFGVFTDATMVVESQDLLTLLISDAGLSQYNDGSCDWKGGHFNKKYIGQIPQKSDINPTLSITGWTYGGQPSTPVLTGNEGNGEVTYQYKVKDSDDANYVTYNPAGEAPSVPTEAGNYTLKAFVVETENYFEATVTAEFEIAKADATMTVPAAIENLVYTGQPQDLITAGSATGGEMQYSLDGQNYDTAIPQGTDVNTYIIYYKVVGDANHNDIDAATITSTISQPVPQSFPYVVLSEGILSFMYGQPDQQVQQALQNGTAWSLDGDWNTACKGTVTAVVFDQSFANYEVTSCANWFKDFTVLESVDAQHLNLNAGNINSMFNGCVKLKSLTIGSSFTFRNDQESDRLNMFNGCTALATGTLIVKGNSAPTIGDNWFFQGIFDTDKLCTLITDPANLLDEQLSDYEEGNKTFKRYKSGYFYRFNKATHAITIVPSNLGTVTIDKVDGFSSFGDNVAASGEKVLIDVSGIADGYELSELNVTYTDNDSQTHTIEITDEGYKQYSFTMVNYPVTVTPVFAIPKTPATVTTPPYSKNLTYNGQPQELVTAGVVDGGTMQYSLDGTTYSTEIPTQTDAGDYPVYYKAVGDDTHNDSEVGTVSAYINTASSEVTTLPTGKTLAYTGQAQELITAGAATGGTLVYKLEGGIYSEDIPTATEASEYTVYYKVDGDKNHDDTNEATVTATISQPIPVHNINVSITSYPAGGDITYSGNRTVGETITLTITPDEGYELLDKNLTVSYYDSNNREQTISYINEENGTKSFTMPEYDVWVSALFTLIPTDGPYVELSDDGKTLTFKYGKKSTQNAWDLTDVDTWNYSCKSSVTLVVFDQRFSTVQPTSCHNWFKNFADLESANLANLNTSQVTDFSYMFSGCNNLKTLIIDGGFTVTQDADITNMFNDSYSHVQLDKLIVMGSTSPTINQDIFENEGFYIINGGRLETENKFELSDIGWNEAYELIEYKGGLFDTYNDYHRMEYTMQGFVFECNPKMATAGTIVTLSRPTDPYYASLTPKATYFNNEGTSVRLTLTETEDGWTFVMPDAHVTISNPSYTAALQLSSEQTTLTILAIDDDDLAQMNNAIAYDTFLEVQKGEQLAGRYEENQIAQYTNFVATCHDKVETVIIDNSISQIRAIWSSAYLFKDFGKLTKIEGLENLNMQNFKSTAYMFAGCSSLSTLTISSNFYIGAARQGEQPGFDASYMFKDCTALAGGTLTVTGTTAPVINQDIFSGVFTNGILVTDPINLFDGSNEVSTQNGKTTYKGGVFSAFNQILYPITITQADHGTVTANNNAAEGETVILTITPDTDYELTGLTISYTDGEGQAQTIKATDGENGTKTFTMPAYPVTITGTFSLVPKEVPYVMQSSDLTTLTFAYGLKPAGSTTWDLNGEWNNDNTKAKVTTVVFDETFVTVKPTSTARWFQGFNALATITGLTNLNTSEVTDMSYMFADCWVLRSVDLSNFNTAKVTDMSHMFETCTYLDNITIGANFTVGDANTTNTADMFNGTSSMISATLTVKGSSPSIGQDIFSEIIYAGQLMTENKFELDGVGTSASYFILYKGGLFMKYNDYNIIQPTNYYSVSPTRQIPNGEVVITSVPDENGRIYPPRVYYNDTEGRVNINVTDLGQGKYSFTMPDSRVFIEAIIYTTLCQLSDDKETLTFWAVEQDEYQQIMQQQMQQQWQGGQQGQQGGQGQGEQSQQQTIMGYSQYISAQKNDNVTDFITACHSQVKTVIFQQSVASALDINGERLLYGFSALTAINGLENLNMMNFSSTKEMFAGCSSLTNLTICKNFYVGDNYDATDMFAGCTGLAGGTLTVTGTTAPVINQDIFSGVFTEGSLNDPDGLLGTEVTTDEDGTKHYKGGVFKTNIEQSENGEATTSSETVNGVKWALVYITPKENYELTSVKVVDKDGNDVSDEVELTDVSTPPYIIMKFKMPTYSVKVKLVFTLKPEAYHEQLTVGANKEWITYYADTYDLTLPQGLEAYYVSNVTLASDGKTGTVTLESTGNKLYKGVPALIRRTDNSTGDLNIRATGARHNDGETVRNSMSANYLGTAVDMSLANQANSQVFVLRDGAFIKANTSTIAAHRCWIRLNATAASRLVLRSGGTTYIDDITTSEQKTEWYDLHGRKLDTKPVGKGVYIQNGKKIVVK